MNDCSLCGRPFDPSEPLDEPAQQAGLFLARERFGDAGELCPTCLAGRGVLAMMYCPEFDG